MTLKQDIEISSFIVSSIFGIILAVLSIILGGVIIGWVYPLFLAELIVNKDMLTLSILWTISFVLFAISFIIYSYVGDQ